MSIDEMKLWTPDWHNRIIKMWLEKGLPVIDVGNGEDF
jgi:hypothetical protein